MLRKSTLVALVVTATLALPAWAQERERTVPLRSFDRFELESETVDGFWAEAGGLYQELSQNNVSAFGTTGKVEGHGGTAFARFAYGGDDKWEGNLFIPYYSMDTDFNTGGISADLHSGNGVGDITLSGKYVPLRGKLLDLGIGGLLSLPSGDANKDFGAGELGGMPYVTSTVHMSIAEVRSHFGVEFFTGSNRDGQASNRLLYGLDIIAPIGKYVAFRNEFSGTNYYDDSTKPKVVSYLPGIDVRIPIGDFDVLLRPTGQIGVTERAPSWGLGGSIAITSPTMRAPAGAAGPGGVTIE